jgi:hypothetical protein
MTDTWCATKPTRAPASTSAPTYKSRWWRECQEGNCPNIVCGSQMRRKAETLLHKNNQLPMTKKQQYSYAIKYGKQFVVNNDSVQFAKQKTMLKQRYECTNNNTYREPYYSNVPGRTDLVFDRTKGLMNYRPVRQYPTSSYSIAPTKVTA